MSLRLAVALMLLAAAQAAAQAADSAAFIIRLGNDTTAIERYVRTARELRSVAVSRSPTTMLHHMVYSFDAQGRVTSTEYSVRRPGEEVNVSSTTVRFQGDSAIVEVRQGPATSAPRTQRVAVKDAIPIAGPFYSPYELAVIRALASGGTATLLSGTNTPAIRVARVGRDSVALNNQFDEPMRAHIDARGRVLHLHTPAYTTVTRTNWVDLERLTRVFATRDSVGKSLGNLSPRVTVRRRVGEANIWLDFGSPRARGRPVWGGLIPYGAVWRMGANDAAHISTDRPLQIGTIALQPGTYTLFLMPTSATQMQLIVNRGTGMSGLDHDPAQDVGRTSLTLRPGTTPVEGFLIDIAGGQLQITWDRTVATVPVQVR